MKVMHRVRHGSTVIIASFVVVKETKRLVYFEYLKGLNDIICEAKESTGCRWFHDEAEALRYAQRICETRMEKARKQYNELEELLTTIEGSLWELEHSQEVEE